MPSLVTLLTFPLSCQSAAITERLKYNYATFKRMPASTRRDAWRRATLGEVSRRNTTMPGKHNTCQSASASSRWRESGTPDALLCSPCMGPAPHRSPWPPASGMSKNMSHILPKKTIVNKGDFFSVAAPPSWSLAGTRLTRAWRWRPC